MDRKQSDALVTASMLWVLVVIVLANKWVQNFAASIDKRVHGAKSIPATSTSPPASPPIVGPDNPAHPPVISI